MLPREIRKIILEQSKRANVGHIGCALSVVDIIAALYGGILRIEKPDDPDRDRFILSKGHAALALYAALHLRGFISLGELISFVGDGTKLGVHPERDLCGVDFSTGSLGLGLSYGAGSAFAARLQGSNRRTFVLLSDAECNEGSTWESVMFAAHHKLSNLIAIIDLNGQQALGYTKDVMNLSPLIDRWRAFGWDAQEADGHDLTALRVGIEGFHQRPEKPHVLLARTVFGKGASFMENKIAWHYMPLSDEQFKQALAEVAS